MWGLLRYHLSPIRRDNESQRGSGNLWSEKERADPATLVGTADAVSYRAKHEGRYCVLVAGPEAGGAT